MKDIVVIHHSADYDGIFCREIARKKFGDDAEYIGWDYGDKVPEITDPHDPENTPKLYMLDISIEPLMSYPGLVWIDHHKTAIEQYGKKPGLQVDGVAACRLAWQYWFGEPIQSAYNFADLTGMREPYVNRDLKEPLAVRLAGEYDVWDKRDERADMFQLGLKGTADLDWDKLLFHPTVPPYAYSNYTNEVVATGYKIDVYKKATDADVIAACAFEIPLWEGYSFLALNTARCNSLTFESGVHEGIDALLAWRYDGKKGMYTVSLYGVPHRPDIDLSVIAKKYGGGGHKQACGFQCMTLPFLEAGS